MPDQSLVVMPKGNLQRAEQLSAAMAQWKSANCHVLTPITDVSALPPDIELAAQAVVFDTGPASGDTYHAAHIHKDQNECSLTKTALDKICAASGINWIESCRSDDRSIPWYWEWSVRGQMVDVTGQVRILVGSASVDMRDESPLGLSFLKPSGQGRRVNPTGLANARAKGMEQAESKAKNRAVRSLGIKQKYTKAELAKAFICLRPILVPKDPEVRRQVTMAAARALYGGEVAGHLAGGSPTAAEPQAEEIVVSEAGTVNKATGEIVEEGAGIPMDEATRPADVAQAEEPDPPEWSKVTSVRRMPADSNSPGAYKILTDRHDGPLWTSDLAVATHLHKAAQAGTRVEIDIEKVGEVTNIVEIVRAE